MKRRKEKEWQALSLKLHKEITEIEKEEVLNQMRQYHPRAKRIEDYLTLYGLGKYYKRSLLYYIYTGYIQERNIRGYIQKQIEKNAKEIESYDL